MTLSPGYRFEATQALRQVLHRAVAWGMLDINPAKVGVDNPRPTTEGAASRSSRGRNSRRSPAAIGPRYGPMILFAAATGLRPAEWIALEKRDIDRDGARRLSCAAPSPAASSSYPKTEASTRAVPLQARALDALDRIEDEQRLAAAVSGTARRLHRPAQLPRPGQWRPAQLAASVDPIRRPYDLRHTYATFALRADTPAIFDLSRFMGREPGDDRPPLRPPRPRRPRTRRRRSSTPDAHDSSLRGRWWTLGGRRN